MRRLVPCLLLLVALSGCDALGLPNAEKQAAAREADGKAVGAACRHAGRAIEDCYAVYRKAERAAVYAGWRDMNDYMRENKIEAVEPQIAAQASPAVATADATPATKPATSKH